PDEARHDRDHRGSVGAAAQPGGNRQRADLHRAGTGAGAVRVGIVHRRLRCGRGRGRRALPWPGRPRGITRSASPSRRTFSGHGVSRTRIFGRVISPPIRSHRAGGFGASQVTLILAALASATLLVSAVAILTMRFDGGRSVVSGSAENEQSPTVISSPSVHSERLSDTTDASQPTQTVSETPAPPPASPSLGVEAGGEASRNSSRTSPASAEAESPNGVSMGGPCQPIGAEAVARNGVTVRCTLRPGDGQQPHWRKAS